MPVADDPLDASTEDDRQNVGSELLSARENRRVFEALGSHCKSLCSGLARLFTVEPRIGWDQLLFGVVCFVRDFQQKRTAIYFVSPGDFDLRNHESPHVLIDIPISADVEFQSLAEDFVVFEAEGVGYGIEFVDENEARVFLTTSDFAQNVRRRNAQRQKEGKDERSCSSSAESTSSTDSCLPLAASRRGGGAESPVSLVFPHPILRRRTPVEFPPPPVNLRKPPRDLRCSFHRRDAIQPATPTPPVRISRFSAQKFVPAEKDRTNKGRKEFFAS